MAHSTRQSNETFDEISKFIWKYLEARDWQHSSARDIATSISLEASELLEHYQWSDNPLADKKVLAAELADILIYSFQFAGIHGIDITDAIRKKLATSAKKYPPELFKNKGLADQHAAWIQAKASYKKESL